MPLGSKKEALMEVVHGFFRLRMESVIAACACIFCIATAQAGETPAPAYHDVAVPAKLSLCGEPVPLDRRSVHEMLDRELTIAAWDHAQVFMWLKRSGRAFPHIEGQLAKLGMPDDLKYLAVAESSLLTYARSPAAAVGTWQMIRETGSRNGLRTGALVDERYSLERSTDAALRYLQKLHGEFGSWALAMAAYNCGEARMRREIDIQGVTDYYRLNLPLETERFIFRIAAIKLIMKHPRRYGYELPAERIYKPLPRDTVAVELARSVPVADLARGIGCDYKTVKELNPELTGYDLPAGAYTLNVPKGHGRKVRVVLQSLGASGERHKKR